MGFPDTSLLKHWLVPARGDFRLDDIDPSSTPGAPGDKGDNREKEETEAASGRLRERLSELQTRLRAEKERSVLLVLQATDCGGKDGTIKSVFLGANPLGVEVSAFGVPTDEDLARDFLWRIHRRAPAKGMIGIFNRSHYEDVLVVRVKNLVPEALWRPRYGIIRHWEEGLAATGTLVLKVMLHISKNEQRKRLEDRLADPTERWKFRAGDLADRKLWDDYMRAYEEALQKTSTDVAPWFCVPADRKWYRNWAVLTILVEALEHLDPKYPDRPDLDGVTVN